MAWTDEQIEELRAECFANDIKYDLAAMQDWDEDKIREFFENGAQPICSDPTCSSASSC